MSSGTTGEPKIVPLGERQLLATARAIVDHHGLDEAERGYCPLPLCHINALVVGVLSTLVSGARLVVDRRFSARSFWATVADQGATWLNLVPGIIAVLGTCPPPAPPAGSSPKPSTKAATTDGPPATPPPPPSNNPCGPGCAPSPPRPERTSGEVADRPG